MKDLATELVELVPHLRQMHQYYSASVCYHAAEFIRNNLTDVKPVVRGEWRKISECSLQCSVCGDTWSVPSEGMGAFRYRMRYCPDCGAYMREKR
jgi:hypothetical protein